MKHLIATLLSSLTILVITLSASAQSVQNNHWELIWSDEFDGSELDSTKWSFQFGTGSAEGLSGWGNAELQYYTDRSENVFLSGGNLHIVARQEAFQGMDYTSARMRSIHNGDWRYGRFEIRAKMPKGQGIWPAIWMMPTDAVYGRWPASGEIDIMELVGHQPNIVHGTVHYGPPHTYNGGSYTRPTGDFSDDFHVYAVEWENGEIRWYIDDILYHTQTNWFSDGHGFPAPFDQRFHFILNIAVGGHWPGSPNHTTQFPQEMVVDYVRVYKDANETSNVSLPVTFEDRFFNWNSAFTNFEGGAVTVVDNPDPDNTNASSKVGKMVKDGGQFYGGAWFNAERSFSFDEDQNEIIMMVWSPREGVPILVKLEQQNGDSEFEIITQTTRSKQWQRMRLPVPVDAHNISWDRIALIFDFKEGQVGDGTENFTWYFDKLDVFGAQMSTPDSPGGVIPVSLPLTFEDFHFEWSRVFTGFSGGEITVVPNPSSDTSNDSDWVGKMVKSAGAFWGGSFMKLENAFVFDEEKHTISMKVWSPRVGVPVLLKLEQQNGVIFYEKAEPTTKSGEWETITWDMSAAGYVNQWDIITLIFDFKSGQIGDGSANFTWYFDDLEVFANQVITSIDHIQPDVAQAYKLHQNYPNPFNPSTVISFELPENTEVSLEVFTLMGQRVSTLANGLHRSGRHNYVFDASHLSSGVYIYRLQTATFSETQKMILVK